MDNLSDKLYSMDKDLWNEAEKGTCSCCFQSGAEFAVRLAGTYPEQFAGIVKEWTESAQNEK